MRRVLQPCTLRYFEAIVDPFRESEGELPCVPDLLDLPSFKTSSKVRGSFTIGAGGFGYVVINPFTNANDANFCIFTLPAFAGTAVLATPGSLNTTTVTDQQLPFATADFRPHRLVAGGIRIRYTGTELNRGGSIVPIKSLAFGAASLDALTLATALATPIVRSSPCDRKWHGCIYTPMFQSQAEYNDTVSVLNAVNNGMGVLVTGEPGNTYEFEIIRYHEYISAGPLAVPVQSKSHSDIMGMSMIRDYVGSLDYSAMGTEVLTYGLDYIAKSFGFSSPILSTGPLRIGL